MIRGFHIGKTGRNRFYSALVDDVKGMKIGIPRDYLGKGLDPEVKEAILAAAKTLEEKGAIVEEFDLVS